MKRILLLITLFISVCGHAQIESVVPKKPSPSEGLVIDKTNTLTPEQESALEQKLVAYDKSTSNQIAVVFIPTLNGYSIEDVALKILRDWGVGGQADKDNGIVILVAKNDRKVRIEVGYGLEGAVTDYASSSIIENNLKPNFKNGDYYRGIDEAVDEIMKAAEGRYTAPPGYGKGKKGLSFGQILLVIFIVWIILAIIGRGGGKGGGYASRRGYRGWSGPIWWGTGGGWSGGGGGGWSGGGGGFGGFGGGSGGGGGASGSW